MQRTGYASLYLHGGHAPPWLWGRMVKLGSSMMEVMEDEYGPDGVLERLSDTFFFQSLSNCLGFDWNSSGTTTVLCGVLDEILRSGRYGIRAVGGKGRRSKAALSQLEIVADDFNFGDGKLTSLRRASRLTAKVDNNMIQAGYQLYHHTMLVSETGGWAVVQQGMNPKTKLARRYHWLSGSVDCFVEEPHEGIVCDMAHEGVLDLTARDSGGNRGTIIDLVKESMAHLKNDYSRISCGQKTLLDWSKPTESYDVPARMNWDAVEKAYELQPENFEELLLTEGLGGKTLRGLSLVAELLYGQKPSWKDPVKYSFAFGGKDGVPFPVLRKDYDRAIEVLEQAVRQSRLGDRDKVLALKRMGRA